jgi:hypothetical protein
MYITASPPCHSITVKIDIKCAYQYITLFAEIPAGITLK